jgi:hypothetical protein
VELLPQSYVVQNIYTYCKRPTYKKHQGCYNAECCICNEGSSAGSKRRLFYFTNDRYFYCFNCSRSWQESSWIQEVSKKSYSEILRESKTYDTITDPVSSKNSNTYTKSVPSIPEDSINLFEDYQCNFFKDTSQWPLIESALTYCQERRLTTAVNRPKALYMSFDDKVHKNRLIIPFYSKNNKIESYQSRVLCGDAFPKYLTKYGEKCLYGENNIDSDIPYIFIFEGPIDAMFVRNAVAMGGTSTTEKQEQFLNTCFGHELIYVYDNDKDNKEVDKKILSVVDSGKKIFIWPKEFSKFKDINEVCTSLQLNEFPYKYIVDNAYSGIEAKLKLKR